MEPGQVKTRADLAAALTALRERAGLSVREVAKAADVPAGTVSGYLSGRHVPPASAQKQVRAVLAACGVTDVAAVELWLGAIRRVRRTPGRRAADAPSPYRGLASFQADDAGWFFGRETLTEALAAMVADESACEPVVVVGPSGSGKSSLVRAGLVPAVRAAAPLTRIVLITPGKDPMGTLAEALEPDRHTRMISAGVGGGSRHMRMISAERGADGTGSGAGTPGRLVVVDQFEELFTTHSPSERVATVRALRDLCTQGARVVVVLRSDFYPQAVELAELVPALQSHQLVVGPMSDDELRRAIREPAVRAGVEVEPGFVDLLLRDLHPRAARTAGALPLFSHTLLATWERGDRKRLTISDYEAVGGLDGAVARTAEDVYAALDSDGQALTRALFLRLVHVVDGEPVARRRVPHAAAGHNDADALAEEVLERYVEARLITADADGVELTHEALLWAWPRLRQWVDEGRDGLWVRRVLGQAAALWRDGDRDPSLLQHGAVLEHARAWALEPEHDRLLSELERDFLDASTRQQRAIQTQEVRRTRWLQALASTLGLLLVAVSALTALSWRQTSSAHEQRDLAVSRQLALTADRLRPTDVSLARQLALAAFTERPTLEARSSLLSAAGTPWPTRVVTNGSLLQAVAVSADGRLMVVGGAGGLVRLVDISDSTHPRTLGDPLPGTDNTVFGVDISPDGRWVAAGGGNQAVLLWDVADPAHVGTPVELADPTGTVYGVRFGPDGTTLAAAGSNGNAWLWRLPATGPRAGLAGQALALGTSPVQSLALSPDGATLAAGGADGVVRLWDLTTPVPAPLPEQLPGNGPAAYALAFSPDGATLAVASSDRTVHRWDVHDVRRPAVLGQPLAGPTNTVNAVTFSPDGAWIVGGSTDNTAWVWDAESGRVVATLPHPAPVTGAAFAPDGRTLATSATDGTARLWTLPGPALGGALGNAFVVSSSADGSLLAVGASAGVQLWDTGDPARPRLVNPAIVPADPARALSASGALSPDGSLLAAGGRDGAVHLFDLRDPAHARQIATLTGPTKLVESVTWSPDGARLAAGTDDNAAWVWDMRDPRAARLEAKLTGPTNYVNSVAFGPDGRLLALGSIDNTAWLWALGPTGTSTPPRQLARLTGPDSYVDGVAISPDGTLLAAGSDDKRVWLWDITDPGHPRAFPTLTEPDTYVYGVAFSRDGTRLAGATGGGAVWVWAVGKHGAVTPYATLTGAAGASYAVTFMPDGRLVSAGADRSARFWELDPVAVRRGTCDAVGDPITPEEWARTAHGVAFAAPCPRPST